MVETGGAVCVEARLSTRSGEMQTYDIYLLQAGMVKQHVGGLISPRPSSGQGSAQGWPQTQGAALYHRYWQALEAQDFATLESLYHRDVISVNCITHQVHQGRTAVIGEHKEASARGVYMKLNSVERFVESSEIICVEATQTAKRVSSMQVDALIYAVVVLHAGRIVQRFGGAISPRGPKLLQTIEQQHELDCKVGMGRLDQIWDAFQNSLYPRRHPRQG